MIQTIILSYIKRFNSCNLEDIKYVVNEPLKFIADEVNLLYKEEYFVCEDNYYSLTEKGSGEELVAWENLINDVDDYLEFEKKIGQIDRNEKGFPVFGDISELKEKLYLDHINIDAYHSFDISKGIKTRVIHSPSKKLKVRQRWILENILYKIDIPDCVHGFVPNKSIVTNAHCHISKKEIGCLDIKDFFPSIHEDRIIEVFKSCGYSDEVSRTLTQVCSYEGVLPQGAPTSPMLANIILTPLDKQIQSYLEENDLIYTRYADDITISGDFGIDNYIDWVSDRIKEFGFEINDKKTHIMKDNYRKVVTGLVVTDKVKIPKRFKRKLRQEIYYCKKYGIEQHLRNSGRESAVNYKEYMYGKAYYIKMVERDIGDKYLEQLDEIFSVYV